MKMRKSRSLLLSILLSLVCTGIARADAVAEWNAHAVQATLTAGTARPGPSGVLDIAVVHAAVYDAVQSITGEYRPYHISVPGAHGSPDAAAATAAYLVLLNRFPGQIVDLTNKYNAYLAANGLSILDPGVSVGTQAANAIIALRAGDGAFPSPAPPPFTGSTAIGQWRPTPAAFSPMNPGPWLGQVRPFTIESPDQFLSDGPPALESNQYARDYKEVKAYGSQTGSSRSASQTDLALFWGGNFVVMMNATVRQLALTHALDISDSSRLFAMTTMANADTTIAVWNEKVHYNFWRPINAIREGDADGNDKTEGHSTWTPLVANPPYPDYGSGANGFSASTMHAVARFFGTEQLNFSIDTTNFANTTIDTREYSDVTQVMDEVVDARIWLGIHFRFADVCSRRLGHNVAKWGHHNYFRPTTGNDY
jgi:hypothetical protein